MHTNSIDQKIAPLREKMQTGAGRQRKSETQCRLTAARCGPLQLDDLHDCHGAAAIQPWDTAARATRKSVQARGIRLNEDFTLTPCRWGSPFFKSKPISSGSLDESLLGFVG